MIGVNSVVAPPVLAGGLAAMAMRYGAAINAPVCTGDDNARPAIQDAI